LMCFECFVANLRVFVQFVRASHSSSLLNFRMVFVKVSWWFVILACLVNSLWVVQVVVLLFSGCFELFASKFARKVSESSVESMICEVCWGPSYPNPNPIQNPGPVIT
jgi:hypothetical protein